METLTLRRARWPLSSFALPLLLLSALGCGGSDGGSGASGAWTGEWLSRSGLGGSASMDLSDTGAALTGTVTFSGSPCFASGALTATLTGGTFDATVTAGAIKVTLTGTITADAMSGTYDAVSAGACTGDTGTFSASR